MPLRIALYVPSLAGGGAESSMLRLAGALVETGYAVDLLLNRRDGAYAEEIPAGVRVIVLRRGLKTYTRWTLLRTHPGDWQVLWRPVLTAASPVMSLRYLAGLTDYLRADPPDALISALFYANLVALWARRVARVSVPVIVTEHNTLSRRVAEGLRHARERTRWRYLAPLVCRAYPRAEAIVAVSDGVADDLAATCGLRRDRITTVYNPVVSSDLAQRAAGPCDHPWFAADQPPVVLSAGRLEPQKNFSSLLDAFARLRQTRPARLIILGEGGQRAALLQQAERLGIEDDISLPGWVDNPYAYMSRARLFALSSRWEGLGNVLIEAMACGCPVVATDCPSGPREVLGDGHYGTLVPVGDVAALAEALESGLDRPTEPSRLRARAADFGVAQSAQQYRQLIESVARPMPTPAPPNYGEVGV